MVSANVDPTALQHERIAVCVPRALNDADRNPTAFADELGRSFEEYGFAIVRDHGIPQDLIDRAETKAKAFFALPEATKALIDKRRSPWFRGWERVGAELTNGRVDHREQIDLSTENTPYPPDVEPVYLRLDGPNQWLPDDVLPGFRKEWHGPFDNQFPGASVSVVVLVADKENT